MIFLFFGLIGNSQVKFYSLEENRAVLSDNAVQFPERIISEQSNQKVVIEYNFKGFVASEIRENDQRYDVIQVNGFGNHLGIGEPSLPVRTEKILIPKNTRPVLTMLGSNYSEKDNIEIYPAQQFLPDDSDVKSEFTIDSARYDDNALFPEEPVFISEIQQYRGMSIAFLKVYPMQYNPVTRKLRIYSDLSFRIDFVPSQEKSALTTVLPKACATPGIVKNITLNPDIIRTYYTDKKIAESVSAVQEGYLILTTPVFKPAADTLAKWKRQLGYYVEVVSQSTWTTSQIKDAVKSRYLSWENPLDYFLILGDQDDLPAEEKIGDDDGDGHDEHWYIDLYYACMDGPTDEWPDIAHGRIPIDTPEEAMIVVKKIILYETDPPTDAAFYRHALHCAYFEESPGFPGIADKRYVHTNEESRNYMIGQGFDIDRVYCTEPDVNPLYYSTWFSGGGSIPSELKRSNGFAWDGDKYDILNGVNQGALYLFHRDHGLQDGWRDPAISNADVAQMNNGNKLPIVFSVNCHSGSFQIDPLKSFSETLLQKQNGGAVGVIASTEITYSGYNDALIEGFLDAIWPYPGLVPVFGTSNEAIKNPVLVPHEAIYTMGDIFDQGFFRMVETWDGWARGRQFERYFYFGDPAMKMWTDLPVQITAQHTPSLLPGAASFEITASNCTDGVATICFNNELQAKIILQNGHGTLTFQEPVPATFEDAVLTISKHNYRPYIAKLSDMAKPVPAFAASRTDICPSEKVLFTDLSTHEPTSWAWTVTPGSYSFSDGTNSHSQNPSIRFWSAGDYTISLTVSNTVGSNTLEKEDYITVMAVPDNPVANDAEICDSGSVMLSASGNANTYRWWSAPFGGTLLCTGSDFQTPVLKNTRSYYVDAINTFVTGDEEDGTIPESLEGCSSSRVQVQVLVSYSPASPLASNEEKCFGDAIPELHAVGNNIRWYNDSELTTLLATGEEYTPQQVIVGENKYYVTQTDDICESSPAEVKIKVHPETSLPIVTDVTLCTYDTAYCVANGDYINWYNEKKTILMAEGSDTLMLPVPEPGIYTLYASNTSNGCESSLVPCVITVNPEPGKPEIDDLQACDGDHIVLNATGEGIEWFADSSASSILHSGNEMDLGQPGVGEYTYYVSQTSLNCRSKLEDITLNVFERPVFDLGVDKTIIINHKVDMVCRVEGEYLWYDGTTENKNRFNSSLYGLGVFDCWVQVTNDHNCSTKDTVVITVVGPNDIHGIPDEMTLLIYPNPTGGILHVGFYETYYETTQFLLTDPQGRIVYLQELPEIMPDTIHDLDLSELKPGVYFLTINNQDIANTYRIILK